MDANGDGGDEVFVIVDKGASVEFLALYGFDGRRLVDVQTVDGKPLGATFGGSVFRGDGLQCADVNRDRRPELVLLSA